MADKLDSPSELSLIGTVIGGDLHALHFSPDDNDSTLVSVAGKGGELNPSELYPHQNVFWDERRLLVAAAFLEASWTRLFHTDGETSEAWGVAMPIAFHKKLLHFYWLVFGTVNY